MLSLDPIYNVYALRYATQPERCAKNNFIHHDLHDGVMPLDFYIWVIQNQYYTIVVDTGFNQEMAKKRSRIFLNEPHELLARLGINLENVTDVILTHMHYDHSGNLDNFPQAKFHIQEKEMAHCTGKSMTYDFLRMPFELENVTLAIKHLFNGRICFHDGAADIVPGVSVHLVGGHTPGLQVVRVATERGYVVLASDAIHYWDNLDTRNPFPIVVDVKKMLSGYETIEQLSSGRDCIIPGHDPNVLKCYPVWQDCTDIVLLHKSPLQ